MKYTCTVIAVADIKAARKFYEDLFGLEVFQDYGRNIAFTCGLALQQDFDGFLRRLEEYPDMEYMGEVTEHSWGQRVIRFYDPDGHIIEVGEDMKMVIKRFLASGMTMEEISVKMDASVEDLMKLLDSECMVDE
jgi:catechol 2,3-dioxygenase-like lactoylglutathione lyase family enzyme